MVPRVFSLAIACLLSLPAHAQLPSSRGSSTNHLGRYHGFGYSDGYHACQDGKCKTSNASSSGKPWKPWEPIAILHAKPTSPATSRLGKTSLGKTSSIDTPPTNFPHRNGRDSESFKPVQSYNPSYNASYSPSYSPIPVPSPSPSSRPRSFPSLTPIPSSIPSSIPTPIPSPIPNPIPNFSLDYSPIPSPSSSQGYLPAPLSAKPVPQWNWVEPQSDPSQFTRDVRDANRMVAQAFPNAMIDVIVNEDGTLVVRGTTDSEKSALRIVEFLRKNFLVPVKDEVSVSRK